jgi:hypothetical protein
MSNDDDDGDERSQDGIFASERERVTFTFTFTYKLTP